MFTAESGEKLRRVGPSSKSLRVEQFRLALLSFFIIFRIEKKRSTLAVENGKLNSNSVIKKMLGHFTESGDDFNWYQIFCSCHIQS